MVLDASQGTVERVKALTLQVRLTFSSEVTAYFECSYFFVSFLRGPVYYQIIGEEGSKLGRRVSMENDLLKALEVSDPTGASECLRQEFKRGTDPWQIHLTLFPVVQRVLNPPFINPHLPKMYRIYREFVPLLNQEEIRRLVSLEVNEYAKRPKLEKLPSLNPLNSHVSFSDVENALRQKDWEKSAVLMTTFYSKQGAKEFARRLLLLGSDYLQDSLGHSISCTAFILLEMLERPEENPWPVLTTLADYFCRGEFDKTRALRKPHYPPEEISNRSMLQATSGRGIVNLHHTITRYAMDRVRHLFTPEEDNHMLEAWREFMGNKKSAEVVLGAEEMKQVDDYAAFYNMFKKLDPQSTTNHLRRLLTEPEARQKLSYILLRGVCDLYQNDYNPHYLTGLGSALWVVDKYWDEAPIATNALFQYVDFFFNGLKSDD